ncbi:MAG: 2OG-Fe(II) oxygenase [Terriglobales bacterium]
MGKIQIHRAGLTVSASPIELEDLSRQFQQQHAIVLEQFLEPGLLARVQEEVGRMQFVLLGHGAYATELSLPADGIATRMLVLLTNNPQLFALIERIANCPPLGRYDGRIYRHLPSPEFFIKWHNDLVEGRQVGMSINLGADAYEGGVFEIRKARKLLSRVANTTPGNALLFRIHQDLMHRVTTVKGGVPKTAFAGWFVDKTWGKPYWGLFSPPVFAKNRSLLG